MGASVPTPSPTVPPEDPPPRATWSVRDAEAPWCPAEWLPHLLEAAPGLIAPGPAAPALEVTGDVARAGAWTLLAAARRGRLHAHRGEHREDAVALATDAAGWCAAVADGAGSAAWSRLGAAIATAVVTGATVRGIAAGAPLRVALETAATETQAALEQFRARTGLATRDLRTTLLVAAAANGALGTLQVGDGIVVLLLADGSARRAHAGDGGEYSGEVTHFLPDPGALDQLRGSLAVHEAGQVHGVFMASDGIDDPFHPVLRHAAALFAQVAGAPPGAGAPPATVHGVTAVTTTPAMGAPDPVAALGAWLGFEKRGENDDRTLCVARHAAVPWAVTWAPSPSA